MNLQFIISHIMNKLPEPPQTAVILGSGLGTFVDCMEEKICIPYTNIPQYPVSTVSGHTGEWVFGYINNKPVICANGRFHYYEGYSMEELTLPISVIDSYGCELIIITNAAGCLNEEWQVGDLMLISGYLDYTFRENSNFPEIVLFEKDVKKRMEIQAIASGIDIVLREGIYTWSLGPSYETPAEIQDIISLGGNAAGMSTVPEMMKAQELELDFIGISCLTNYGAGMKGTKLSHKDVLKASGDLSNNISKLLSGIISLDSNRLKT